MKPFYWETHLYTYGVMLTISPDLIFPDTLRNMRAKALRFGHTEGECLAVERNPFHYIRHGKFADESATH